MAYDVLVLMSTYNGEKYINEQIDSILNQKGCNVELLIRDDGSRDNTVDIIEKYARQYANISVIHDKTNLGAAHSFLSLLHDSKKHNFYAFADQDDIWDADKLIEGITRITDYAIPMLYASNARLVNAEGVDVNELEHKEKNIHLNAETLLCINQFLGCTMVFNDALADLVRKVKLPDFVIMHDYYLSCICTLCGGEVIYDSQPHMSYRQHGNNVEGISLDFWTKCRKKLSFVFSPKKVYVYMQMQDLNERYMPYMKDDLKKFVGTLIKMDHSLKARFTIGLSTKVHYANFNQACIYRCAYLLGNK